MKNKKEITQKVNSKIEKTHKDYFLKEQIKAIQKELGSDNKKDEEIKSYKKRLKAKKEFMPKEAYKETKKTVRGGSWKDVGYLLMTGYRDWERKDSARSYIGFRTIQDVPAGSARLRTSSK